MSPRQSLPSRLKSRCRSSVPKLLFPFLDLKAEYATMKAEIQAAIEQVLEGQQFIMGPQVRELEAEVAAFIGCDFAVACASGSDALLLALMALEVDSGDEIITTPFTFVATAGSIARLKAKPVFVDIDPETYNLDAKAAGLRHHQPNQGDHASPLVRAVGRYGSITEVARAHRSSGDRGRRPVDWRKITRADS